MPPLVTKPSITDTRSFIAEFLASKSFCMLEIDPCNPASAALYALSIVSNCFPLTASVLDSEISPSRTLTIFLELASKPASLT